jgi:hypothetical protein
MGVLKTIDKSKFGKFQKGKLNKSEQALIHGGAKSKSTWGAHVGEEDDPVPDGLTGGNRSTHQGSTDHWVHWSGGDNSLYAN